MVKVYTFDTSFIVKGFVVPRRKKKDFIFKEQLKRHLIAKCYLEQVNKEKVLMYIPSLALIEVAIVIARLTNNQEEARNAIQFLRENAFEIFYDVDILNDAISLGIEVKLRSFDTMFLTVARNTNSILLTDDKLMHETALRIGIESLLLREMVN